MLCDLLTDTVNSISSARDSPHWSSCMECGLYHLQMDCSSQNCICSSVHACGCVHVHGWQPKGKVFVLHHEKYSISHLYNYRLRTLFLTSLPIQRPSQLPTCPTSGFRRAVKTIQGCWFGCWTHATPPQFESSHREREYGGRWGVCGELHGGECWWGEGEKFISTDWAFAAHTLGVCISLITRHSVLPVLTWSPSIFSNAPCPLCFCHLNVGIRLASGSPPTTSPMHFRVIIRVVAIRCWI